MFEIDLQNFRNDFKEVELQTERTDAKYRKALLTDRLALITALLCNQKINVAYLLFHTCV